MMVCVGLSRSLLAREVVNYSRKQRKHQAKTRRPSSFPPIMTCFSLASLCLSVCSGSKESTEIRSHCLSNTTASCVARTIGLVALANYEMVVLMATWISDRIWLSSTSPVTLGALVLCFLRSCKFYLTPSHESCVYSCSKLLGFVAFQFVLDS
jgi:hypothetical protein